MRTQLKKASVVVLLSSLVLLLTLIGAPGASAKTIQRHTFIPFPIFFPFPSTFLPSQFEVSPIINLIGDTNQILDSNGCFSLTIKGRFFSPSYYDATNTADLYANDSSGDSLDIHPSYIRVNSEGEFTRGIKVCGISSTETNVTIGATDDTTGISSNAIAVDINEE